MSAELIAILFLIAFTSFCDTLGQLFLKSAINSLGVSLSANLLKILRFILRLVLLPRVWASGLFSLCSLFIWLFVLSRVDLNFAFSLDSMHYLFIALASMFILKEKVGWQRWLGTFFIVLGIVMVSLS